MRLKLISKVFVCLLVIFLMSHNSASAMGSYVPDTAIGRFNAALHNNFDGSDACSTQDPLYIRTLYTNLPLSSLNAGYDYIVSFSFFNAANSNSFDGKIPITIKTFDEAYYTIKEIELHSVSPSQLQLYMVIHVNQTGGSAQYMQLWSDDYFILYNNECVTNWGWFTRVQWTNTQSLPNYSSQLNAITQQLNAIGNSQPTQQQITNLNNSVNNLNSTIENHYQKEQQSVDNISGQQPSDIGNTDSQETTSLINTITNFVNALKGLSATNCNVSLQFPQFAGGTQTVNVCQNKEYTGNIVSIAGSIFLVVFYIPIAWLLLRMIYNEIRSYTNG